MLGNEDSSHTNPTSKLVANTLPLFCFATLDPVATCLASKQVAHSNRPAVDVSLLRNHRVLHALVLKISTSSRLRAVSLRSLGIADIHDARRHADGGRGDQCAEDGEAEAPSET